MLVDGIWRMKDRKDSAMTPRSSARATEEKSCTSEIGNSVGNAGLEAVTIRRQVKFEVSVAEVVYGPHLSSYPLHCTPAQLPFPEIYIFA